MILLFGEDLYFLPYFNYPKKKKRNKESKKKKKKDQNISLGLLPSEPDFSGKFPSLSFSVRLLHPVFSPKEC